MISFSACSQGALCSAFLSAAGSQEGEQAFTHSTRLLRWRLRARSQPPPPCILSTLQPSQANDQRCSHSVIRTTRNLPSQRLALMWQVPIQVEVVWQIKIRTC
ncbi:hypothetical protein NQZ68_030885 [Dissostichus eleginoides]|nr:hypothetical protein NQZ68_030885 [Dissostichus eleginoides]